MAAFVLQAVKQAFSSSTQSAISSIRSNEDAASTQQDGESFQHNLRINMIF